MMDIFYLLCKLYYKGYCNCDIVVCDITVMLIFVFCFSGLFIWPNKYIPQRRSMCYFHYTSEPATMAPNEGPVHSMKIKRNVWFTTISWSTMLSETQIQNVMSMQLMLWHQQVTNISNVNKAEWIFQCVMKSEIPNGTKDDRNTNSCYCQQLYVCNNSYSFSSVIYTENCGTVYYDCLYGL